MNFCKLSMKERAPSRPPYFAQLFGVNRSSLPSLVFHENLIPLSEALKKQENIVFTMIPYEDRPPVAIQMTLSAMILPTDSIRHDTVTSSISWNQNRLIESLWIRVDHRMLCIGPSTSAADMDFLMPQISFLRSALDLSVPSMISPKSGSEREGDVCIGPAFLCPTTTRAVYCRTSWKPQLVPGRLWQCNYPATVVQMQRSQWKGWTRVQIPAQDHDVVVTATCRVKLSKADLQLLQLGYVSQCDALYVTESAASIEYSSLQLIESVKVVISITIAAQNRGCDRFLFIELLSTCHRGLDVHQMLSRTPVIYCSADPAGSDSNRIESIRVSFHCEYRPRFVTRRERDNLNLYHKMNGFDPETTECARMLGMPIFELQ
ncbi:hypothetical protein WG66_000903 [Moniliophthora roreri]|nr:hypothetical protein WG66_000903 [Moniliophthora roreri]